jgi:hypothetical protein
MEPENFQKENNNHTLTNILLFLVLLVMVIILFLMVKNQKKESSEIVDVPAEQVPSSNPVINPPTVAPNPTPESNPTPTPVTTIQQNIPLVVGNRYQVMFSSDDHAKPYIFCGEGEMTYDDVGPISYNYFLPWSQGCSDDMPGGQDNAQYMSLNMFSLSPKPSTTEDQIKALNSKYGAVLLGKTGLNYNIRINNQTNPYNTYTLVKIYFDSGLFYSTSIKDIRYF